MTSRARHVGTVTAQARSTSKPSRSRIERCSSGGEVEADQAVRAVRPEGNAGAFRETVVDVDRGDRLGGGEVDEQAAGERCGRLCRVRVDALLPLVRPLRAEPEPLGGAEDADRLEVRRLEEQLGRRLGDLRLEASHDRRERNRTLAVGDQQVARPELAERAVERAEGLAFAGAPHEDAPAREKAPVERVERAAPHMHDVVRHVDDVRDGAHPCEMEPAPQPLGRRADADVTERPADVARAAQEVLDRDVEPLVRNRRRIVRNGRPKLAVAQRGDLARDADHREEVGPVHRRCHIEDAVDERQDVRQRRAGLEPVGEQHDPGVVCAEPDLVLREDHPAGHLAAERPFLERPGEAGQERAGKADGDRRARAEVPRAADDLLRVRVADVDVAELQPIGVRVGIGGDHPSDDEVGEVATLLCHAHVDQPVDLE